MIRILIVTLIILNNCGKKGNLYLDGSEASTIIEIDEERIYKF
jgi:predicted small lipoprotein YifL